MSCSASPACRPFRCCRQSELTYHHRPSLLAEHIYVRFCSFWLCLCWRLYLLTPHSFLARSPAPALHRLMALDRPQRLPCLPDQGAHPQIGRTAAVLLADIYVLCRASLPLAITTIRTFQSRLRLRQIRPPTSLLPEEPCHLSPSSARRFRRLAAALSRQPLPPFFSPRSQLAGPRLVAPQPSRHNLTPPPQPEWSRSTFVLASNSSPFLSVMSSLNGIATPPPNLLATTVPFMHAVR